MGRWIQCSGAYLVQWGCWHSRWRYQVFIPCLFPIYWWERFFLAFSGEAPLVPEWAQDARHRNWVYLSPRPSLPLASIILWRVHRLYLRSASLIKASFSPYKQCPRSWRVFPKFSPHAMLSIRSSISRMTPLSPKKGSSSLQVTPGWQSVPDTNRAHSSNHAKLNSDLHTFPSVNSNQSHDDIHYDFLPCSQMAELANHGRYPLRNHCQEIACPQFGTNMCEEHVDPFDLKNEAVARPLDSKEHLSYLELYIISTLSCRVFIPGSEYSCIYLTAAGLTCFGELMLSHFIKSMNW